MTAARITRAQVVDYLATATDSELAQLIYDARFIPDMAPATGLLTTAEVAAMLRTSPETVRYWRHIGRGPSSFKVGRRVVYDAGAVQAWLDEQRPDQ